MMTAAADTAGVGSRCEDGSMTTARARAVDGLDLTGYDVVQTNTLTSTAAGNITVRAVARSTEILPHEASGPNYAAALKAYLQSIPDGWISLGITVDA
jgi:hypothetical protein